MTCPRIDGRCIASANDLACPVRATCSRKDGTGGLSPGPGLTRGSRMLEVNENGRRGWWRRHGREGRASERRDQSMLPTDAFGKPVVHTRLDAQRLT